MVQWARGRHDRRKKSERVKELIRNYTKDDDPALRPLIPNLAGDEADIEEAWRYFTWMEVFDWKFLPYAGALEDQDETLMDNILMLADSVRRIKRGKEG